MSIGVLLVLSRSGAKRVKSGERDDSSVLHGKGVESRSNKVERRLFDAEKGAEQAVRAVGKSP